MLLLSRVVGEKVYIGPDIVITVVHVGGDKVRIGIDAPRAVAIYRSELIPPGAPVPPSNARAAGVAAACLPPAPEPR